MDHLGHLAAPHREQLRDHSDVFLRNIDREHLHRFVKRAFDLPRDYGRFGYLQLEPFPPHGLDQDGQLELASAGDPKGIRRICFFDAQAHVFSLFVQEPLAQLARGHELSLAAGPG